MKNKKLTTYQMAVTALMAAAMCVLGPLTVIALLALRPLVKKYVTPKVTATNVDSIVGSTGLVTAAIDNVSASGQVKLGAMEWTARSTSGQPIPVGTLVKVDKIEGVKAFVSPAEVPANVT